jgi:hypothetical protein
VAGHSNAPKTRVEFIPVDCCSVGTIVELKSFNYVFFRFRYSEKATKFDKISQLKKIGR